MNKVKPKPPISYLIWTNLALVIGSVSLFYLFDYLAFADSFWELAPGKMFLITLTYGATSIIIYVGLYLLALHLKRIIWPASYKEMDRYDELR